MPSDALPDDLETLKAMLLAERMQNERLRQIIREMQRHRFGRRAETLPEDQMLLGLEDVEQTLAGNEAAADQMTLAERAARAEKRRSNRGSLPAHLPRIEIVVDIDDKTCPCCQGELHRIGEDKSERLDIVPAQFRVLVTVRPKYACRKCEDGVLQAPAPAQSHHRPGIGIEICRPSAALSASPDLRPSGNQPGPVDLGGLGWSCCLAPAPAASAPADQA
jgi:transposase